MYCWAGTYTGDVCIMGMHDRRGGADDVDRQIVKIGAKFIHPDHDNPARSLLVICLEDLWKNSLHWLGTVSQ